MKDSFLDPLYVKCKENLNEVYSTISSFFPSQTSRPVIVALSGGADSTILLHFVIRFYQEKSWPLFEIYAVYVDHGWREESQYESAELQKRCETLGISFYGMKIENREKGNADLENRARYERYKLLLQCSSYVNSPLVLVGHQRDDQVEGVLKRIFEGAPLHTFSGMKKYRILSEEPKVWLFRPLITIARSSIESWLYERNIQYYTDPTNSSYAFTRARLRHGIIPLLSDYFQKKLEVPILEISRKAEALSNFVKIFRDSAFTMEHFSDQEWSIAVKNKSDLTVVAMNTFILEEIFHSLKEHSKTLEKMSREQIADIARAFLGEKQEKKAEKIFESSVGSLLVRKGFLFAMRHRISAFDCKEIDNFLPNTWYCWSSSLACHWEYIEKSEIVTSPCEENQWKSFFKKRSLEVYIPSDLGKIQLSLYPLSDTKLKKEKCSLICPFSTLRLFFPALWKKNERLSLLYSPLVESSQNHRRIQPSEDKRGGGYIKYTIRAIASLEDIPLDSL